MSSRCRGYWMSVSSILNLLNELNMLLCEPLASMILFYWTSLLNSVINLHEFNILLITFQKNKTVLSVKKVIFHWRAYTCSITRLYYANDVTSKYMQYHFYEVAKAARVWINSSWYWLDVFPQLVYTIKYIFSCSTWEGASVLSV
jgi:hypothetical protein